MKYNNLDAEWLQERVVIHEGGRQITGNLLYKSGSSDWQTLLLIIPNNAIWPEVAAYLKTYDADRFRDVLMILDGRTYVSVLNGVVQHCIYTDIIGESIRWNFYNMVARNSRYFYDKAELLAWGYLDV